MKRRVLIVVLLPLLAAGGQALSSNKDAPAPGAAVSAVGDAQPASATFAAVADAYVSSSARRSNFGRARVLRIGAREPKARTYIRFHVKGLAAPVTRATLRVFSKTASRGGFSVGATSGRWSERRITDANAPRTFRRIGATAARLQAGRWVSVNVTRAVAGNGTVDLLLVGREATTLLSREGGRGPRLIVEAEPPAPTTLIAVGDIASCSSTGDEQTAAVVAEIPGTVAALGDLAYESGSARQFANCYEPSWGGLKARTRPTPGNHEYATPGASGYFGYWGLSAGTPGQGWYAYDLGTWHVIVLNSNCAFVGGCHAGSAQEIWLRSDLAANRSHRCTLAYWHHPRLSSGVTVGDDGVIPFWQALYDAGADLVLAGHAHNYQRWAPLRPDGSRDDARGLRQFVVGTGGRSLHRVTPRLEGQEAVNDDSLGVLRLTLHPSGYDWRFIGVPGTTFADSGSAACH